ncbi:MAG: tetratricopeptide repeat protein [Proteobacteria bacterium]|nr:tetratricopeptide repeat protein [Pseudomonadota bacterium]
MKNRYSSLVLLLCTCFMVVSCESLRSLTSKDDFYSGQKVLFQRGDTFPEYSDIDESQWISIASRPELSVDKIYATLVKKGSSQALTEARKFLLRYPGDLDGFEALARMLYVDKQLGLAEHYAQYILSKDPRRVEMYNILGLVKVYQAESMQDFRQAEMLFEKAADGSGTGVVALLNLGFMYLEMGALDRARSSFDRAYERCGQCSPALLGLGITYKRLEQPQEAIAYLEQALKTSMPTKTRYKFYFHLALILRKNPQTRLRAQSLLVEIVNNLPSKDQLAFRSQSVINEMRLRVPPTSSR